MFENWANWSGTSMMGGAFWALMLAFVIIAIILFITFWIYSSLAWMTIARKLKYKKGWLAWIPFARTAMKLQLGKKFHWAWVFLYLVPILGWIAICVLSIISTWEIFERRKYSGWLALIPIAMVIPGINWLASLAYLIVIGFVAWKDM